MSKGFCYFLPGPGQRNAEQLLPLGVLPLVPGEGVASRALGSHAGGAGALCWIEAPGVSWHYEPSAQTWRRIPKEASGQAFDYWIGWETATPPAPEALARAKRIGGKEVAACGHMWHVPAPRLLPQVYTLNEDGTQGLGVAPAYREAYRRAEAFIQAMYVNGAIPFDDLLADVALALSLNYRIGRFELLALGALDTREALNVMRVAADTEAFEAAAKKKMAQVGTTEAAPGAAG